MCGIVCIIQDVTASLFDLKPPFWGHHTDYIKHCVHSICFITPTLLMIKQSLYVWYHIQYVWDILSTYLWHHTHYVWQHKPVCWIHHTRHMYDIICTTEDVTSTLSHQATIFMTSHPLQTWHHTQCIYDIISNMYAITIRLSWQHNDYTWHLTHHIWPHRYCICVITQMAHTSVSMYRCIDDITTSV